MILSEVMPSASAWKVVTIRWRRTGLAMWRTSAIPAWRRPFSAARALAASISDWPARGPAPQETHFLTKSVDSDSFGRLARTISRAYWKTCSATGTRRIKCCSSRICSPESVIEGEGESSPVVRRRISSSSSAVGYGTRTFIMNRSSWASGSG